MPSSSSSSSSSSSTSAPSMFTHIGHFGAVASRYDPDIIPALEAHVDKQLQPQPQPSSAAAAAAAAVAQQETQQGSSDAVVEAPPPVAVVAVEVQKFDEDANLALLKLYQFFPERMNHDYVAKVLLLGLMHIASTPLSVYLSLIPDRFHSRPDLALLIALSALLETAQFSKFWEEIRKPEAYALVSLAKDFEEAIRQFIIGVLVITYRRIDVPSFCGCLQIDQSEVLRYVQANNHWETDGTFISFPLNEFTQPKPRKANALNFQEVLRVLNA